MPRLLDLRSLRDADPRRICIIKPSALGDVVQSLPVLGAVRARWPDATVCWVIRDDLADLVSGHPLVDEWLPYERRRGARAFVRLLRQLRARRFDLAIDLQGLARSAVMTAATGAAIRVGLENSRDAAFLAHNLVLPGTGAEVPAHARYWRLAEMIDCPDVRSNARFSISSPARFRAVEMLECLSGTMMAIHPGAAWATKRWPAGRFAAVAARAVRELNSCLVVIGGPEERSLSTRFVSDLHAAAPGAIVRNLTGRTSVGELAAVLERIDLLLTNDSGPMHLAAALGTPVVGVFTATDPHRSGPALGSHEHAPGHELVATASDCRACYRRRCPHSGQMQNACQRDLSVDHVWQAVLGCAKRNGLLANRVSIPEAAAAEPVLSQSG